ncbi:transposase [Desulfococcus sp.]|uniref:transposase n=1 Tax=Desulfococcus sp. TaxID=2025834 RepID=UPI003593292B
MLSEIVRQMKTFSARRINNKRCTPGVSVWQRNYREHIVRNETELNHIRQYIRDNPARWESDKLYTPTAARPDEIREPASDYGLDAWMI